MKRLERLTALLSYLQSRRYTSISLLQEKFSVSERTIYRDIRALEESGVPVGFEKDLGYYIYGGHFLPPLAFTVEEARSFIFVDQLARKYVDEETYACFSSALEKVRNRMNDQQLEASESLQSRVLAYVDEKYATKHLAEIERACTRQQVLYLHYQDFNGNRTERAVEPIGLTFYSQAWHMIAFCRLRDDYRDFSLQRIEALEVISDSFSRKHLSLPEYIQQL